MDSPDYILNLNLSSNIRMTSTIYVTCSLSHLLLKKLIKVILRVLLGKRNPLSANTTKWANTLK